MRGKRGVPGGGEAPPSGREQEWLAQKWVRYGVALWVRQCRGAEIVHLGLQKGLSNWCFEVSRVGTCYQQLDDFFSLLGNRAGPRHIRGRCDSQHEGMPRIRSRC